MWNLQEMFYNFLSSDSSQQDIIQKRKLPVLSKAKEKKLYVSKLVTEAIRVLD